MPTNPGLAGLFSLLETFTALRRGHTGHLIDTSGYNGAVNFEITGADGGNWHCVLRTGYLRVHRGAHAAPLGTVRVSTDDFFRIVARTLSCPVASMTGRLRVEGDGHAGMVFGGMIQQIHAARREKGLFGIVARWWTDRSLARSGCGLRIQG